MIRWLALSLVVSSCVPTTLPCDVIRVADDVCHIVAVEADGGTQYAPITNRELRALAARSTDGGLADETERHCGSN